MNHLSRSSLTLFQSITEGLNERLDDEAKLRKLDEFEKYSTAFRSELNSERGWLLVFETLNTRGLDLELPI